MVAVGNKSKRPTPARHDHPPAIPDRSCPARPRRSPPIVAVPFTGDLGAGFFILIDTHPRKPKRLAQRNQTEIKKKSELRAVAFPRL